MRILLFGATGYVGRHVCERLIADGNEVSAFVRSDAAGKASAAIGAEPILGDIGDLRATCALFADHDAVIFIAQLMLDEERSTVEAFTNALEGTGKALIFTSGTSLLSERTDGDWSENCYTEAESFEPRKQIAPRLQNERIVREAALRGVRSMCIRPPHIWGNGGSRYIADFYESARRTGSVCYVGQGLNVYSSVHVEDLADLYSKALERGAAGALYHAVSGETCNRVIAETIARHLEIPSRSVSPSEAVEIWGKFTGGIIFTSCSRTRAPRSRVELGWKPDSDRQDILEDCVHPAYSDPAGQSPASWDRKTVP